MFPNIEQKAEGPIKKVVIKQKISLIEVLLFVIFFSFFLIPFYKAYTSDPDVFSLPNRQGIFLISIFIIILLMFFFLQYSSKVYIIRDVFTGLIRIEKKSLVHRSYVFNKKENPILKLSKLPFMLLLFSKQRYNLSILSNGKRIILNPDITLQKLTTPGRYFNNGNNTSWTYTKEEAKNISTFLNMPLSHEIGESKETSEYNNA